MELHFLFLFISFAFGVWLSLTWNPLLYDLFLTFVLFSATPKRPRTTPSARRVGAGEERAGDSTRRMLAMHVDNSS